MFRGVVRRTTRHGSIASALAGLVAAAAMALRLLRPFPVGMANNGDADRLMCQVGADANMPIPGLPFRWAYAEIQYPSEPPGARCVRYPSTQAFNLRLIAWIHQHVLGRAGAIDMREVILEYALLTGLVIAALALILRSLSLILRLLVLLAVFLVMADATFADYMASPYSDSMAIGSLAAFSVAAVVTVSAGRWRRTAYGVACVAGVLAVATKTETVTLAVPLAVFLGSRRVEIGRLAGRIGSRVVPVLAVLSLTGAALWTLGGEGDFLRQVNVADELTLVVMTHADDPGQAAIDFGLPRSFAKYAGTQWFMAQPIENDPQYPAYTHLFTRQHMAGYFATHPTVAARILASGNDSAWAFRTDYLGSYPPRTGHEAAALECRLCLLPTASRTLKGTGFTGLVTLWGLALIWAGWLFHRSNSGSRRRAFALVAVCLIGCFWVQYLSAVYGEGLEVTKHLAVGLFAGAFALVWLLAGSLQRTRRQAVSDTPELPEASASETGVPETPEAEPLTTGNPA